MHGDIKIQSSNMAEGEGLAVAPTDCYKRNLAALATLNPAVADAVDSAPIPETIEPATGRDGTRTFLIPSKQGRREWLGRSSMPTISAREIFSGFSSDGRSVVLPGVLTGLEPIVVAEKTPSHAAVFVAEPSPLCLKLAMHVHDYTALLTGGRLVFLLGKGEELVSSLFTFIETHPGYELPIHLLPIPQRSPVQIAELQRWIETAGGKVTELHELRLNAQVRTLSARKFEPLSNAPRVALLCVDPRPVSLEQAARIGRALTHLKWPHQLCVPDAPDKCHATARMEAINQISAELVLFVNTVAAASKMLLPDDLAVVSWYLPGAAVQASVTAKPVENQIIFASSRAGHDELVHARVPASVIERCDVAADDIAYRPVRLLPEDRAALAMDVAILFDLPDDRPEVCNITLASHLTLWRSLQDAVKRNVGRYQDDIAEELLQQAQHDSGTVLHESQVREFFLALLRARIAPSAIARVAAETMIDKGYRVGLWGCNWPPLGRGEDSRQGLIPAPEPLNRIFNAVGLVLLPDSSPATIQTSLDALAAGTLVICRSLDRPFEREYPDLAALLPHLNFYRSARELLDTVAKLTSPGGDSSAKTEAGRAMVRAHHTVTRRLETIVKTMRSRQTVRIED